MASDSEDDIMDVEGAEDDLFGSEDGDEAPKVRELSDRELDSGDDEGRSDRAPDTQNEEIDYETGRELRILDQVISRHPVPKPVGGEVSSTSLIYKLALTSTSLAISVCPSSLVSSHALSNWTSLSCH